LLIRVEDFSPKTLPEESNGRGAPDATVVDITGSACDDTSHDQTHNDADVLEEWGSKNFRQNNRNEGDESETDELGRSPPTEL
jgi:hypothetical protein